MEGNQKVLRAIQSMPESQRELGETSINVLSEVIRATEDVIQIALGSEAEQHYLLVVTSERIIYLKKDDSEDVDYRSVNYEDVKEVDLILGETKVKLVTANSSNYYQLEDNESLISFVNNVKRFRSAKLVNQPPPSIKEKSLLVGILKSKWAILIAAALIILIIGNGMGKANAKVPLNDKKVDYDQLVLKIQEKEKELAATEVEIEKKQEENTSLDDEKNSISADISKHQAEFDEGMEVSKNKDKILKEISSHEKDLEIKKKDLEGLEGNIASKQEELETVNQLIKEKGEEPIQLSAGTFTIGSDVPAGRYKAMPVGRGSNFVVYDSAGRLDVNTILGSYGEPEYIFFAEDGGTIESASTAKLVPVE